MLVTHHEAFGNIPSSMLEEVCVHIVVIPALSNGSSQFDYITAHSVGDTSAPCNFTRFPVNGPERGWLDGEIISNYANNLQVWANSQKKRTCIVKESLFFSSITLSDDGLARVARGLSREVGCVCYLSCFVPGLRPFS